MLTIVPLAQDLSAAVVDELLRDADDDLSDRAVVFPNQRQLLFLREELGRRRSGPFFPPRLLTVEALVDELFHLNHPGFGEAGEMDLAHAVFESVGSVFPDGAYLGGRGGGFCAFYPAALQLLRALEEVLVEGGELPGDAAARTFVQLADLGDYHRDYQGFIGRLPLLAEAFAARLQALRLCSRGLQHREVARLAAAGTLRAPPLRRWIFAGFHVLTRSEGALFSHFFRAGCARLLLHTDPHGLHDPLSPFHLQRQTLAALGLTAPAAPDGEAEWNRFAGKVTFYPMAGNEAQMAQIAAILAETATARDEAGLRRVGVALPDSGGLIPFVQGVVSRLEKPLPFNITLAYPLRRTPVFQLLDSMLRLRETAAAGPLRAADYLALMRHPYIKLSAGGGEALRSAIHRADEAIGARNLARFTAAELEAALASLPEGGAELAAALRAAHDTFLLPPGASPAETISRLRRALGEVAAGGAGSGYLFLAEYLRAAEQALGEAAEFFARHPGLAPGPDFAALANLLRGHLDARLVGLEGSPLSGVQVMGMLEFRGLPFDEVIIADAVEGVLPPSRKYDPLLPYDIRRLLGIRSHTDWESLYAHNFFSLLASARRVHLLYPAGSGGKSEPSRFIAKIRYELTRRGQPAPEIRWQPFSLRRPVRETPAPAKTEALREQLRRRELSPSALADYIACPMHFYHRHLLHLQEREELSEESDAGVRGSIVHEALGEIFSQAPGHWLALRGEERRERVRRVVESAYERNQLDPQRGVERIRAWAMVEKLATVVAVEAARLVENRVEVGGTELEYRVALAVPALPHPVGLRGTIDRIETQDGLKRVVDFKTGAAFTSAARPEGWPDLANLARLEGSGYREAMAEFRRRCPPFQILFYSLLLAEAETLDPAGIDALYVFLKEPEPTYGWVFAGGRRDGPADPERRREVMAAFRSALNGIFTDLFSRPDFPANPLDPRRCRECPYATLCGATG